MSLTPDDIARIANLARLELHPDESERMLTQINGFFGIVEAMRAVDTTGVSRWPIRSRSSRTLRCA
jgi:aspartyl-tRNA(Asn)/glutamyl-tRNA(Gln) amidotransferase subunit C